ncbi:dystrobrevin beta [Trichonephila clavipes]|nr:dystrobrevin beta [Trichonephila clavipes]
MVRMLGNCGISSGVVRSHLTMVPNFVLLHMDSAQFIDNMSYGSVSQGPSADYCHLMAELKAQNFDVMKFSSYRTACKLRFIQKRISCVVPSLGRGSELRDLSPISLVLLKVLSSSLDRGSELQGLSPISLVLLQVLSSSLDRGSELQGLSPISLVLLQVLSSSLDRGSELQGLSPISLVLLQVLSSSLDRGSELRDLSPISLVLLKVLSSSLDRGSELQGLSPIPLVLLQVLPPHLTVVQNYEICHQYLSCYLSYTRAFGDGPRNFEPWSSDVDDNYEIWHSPNYQHLSPRVVVSDLDRFNVHRCPTRRVFSGTGIELVTRQATIRYLYHSATAATQVHSVDIWNVIEAFRENGLNSLEPRMEINIPRLETLVTSIYFQLNKRLPSTQQIDLDQCTSLLLNWLTSAYDPEETGKVRVFSIKIALATMCSGKLMDKLRYAFSLICDNNGLLVQIKFADFLREILQVPCSVHESPTFGYRDNLPSMIIDGKSPSKQLGHSLKKSFRCVPEKQTTSIPRFPEEPEKTLNLQHIVPPSPIPSHNGFHDVANNSFDMSSLDGRSTTRRYNFVQSQMIIVVLYSLLLLLMPPDWQRPDQGPRNSSWQRAMAMGLLLAIALSTIQGTDCFSSVSPQF